MAIAFGTAGTSNNSITSTLTVPYPASISAGDLLVCCISNKYPGNGPSTPSGWTLASGAQQFGGHGSPGVASGNTFETVFHKVATGSESGSLSVTITGNTEALGQMYRFTKGSSNVWQVSATNGSFNTVSTSWSITTATDPGIASGDMVLCASSSSSSRTWTAEACSCSGVTFGTAVEMEDESSQDADWSAQVVSRHPVTTGPSGGNLTYTKTASNVDANGPCGATVVLLLHELTPQTITVGSAIATGFSSSSPAVTQQIKPTLISSSEIVGGPHAVAVTQAIITQPGETMHIAGYTVEQFSAFTSIVDGATDLDFSHFAWDFGDGSSEIGHTVQHIYANPGTHTVTLTGTTDAGTISTATVDVTTASFIGTTIFVSTAGGNDANNGLSTGSPKKTLAGAIAAVSPSSGSPYRISLNRGEIFTWSSADSTNKPRGPCIFDAYGTGAIPIVQVIGDVYFQPSPAVWGRSLLFNNWAILWGSRGTSQINAWANGSSFVNCTINNASLVYSGTGGIVGAAAINCTISNSNYLGIYSSAPWTGVVDCVIFGHGADNSHHHQTYFSGCSYPTIRRTEAYVGAGVAFSGHKCSGCQKGYIADNYTHDNCTGYDCGANSDDAESDDFVYERNRIINSNVAGLVNAAFWINWTQRYVYRNNIIAGTGTAGGRASMVIGIAAGYSGKLAQTIRIEGNTFYGNAGGDIQIDTNAAAITFKNNIIHRTANCNVGADILMIETIASGMNAQLTSDYNIFYASSPATDTSSSNCFTQDGTARSFTTWVSTASQDAHSTFGNPGMTSPSTGDFTIGNASTAKDAGAVLGLLYDDFLKNRRPSGAGYDVGAYEFIASGNTLSPTKIATHESVPTTAALKMKMLPVTIASSESVPAPSIQMKLQPTHIATAESVPTTAAVTGGTISGGGGGSPPQISGPTVYGPNVLVGCLHVGLANSWVTLNDGAAAVPGGSDKGEIVSSDNTNDKAAGTGALTAGVEYLDSTGASKSETFVLTGTAAVLATRSDWWRVNDFYVKSYGSAGANAGTLTLRKNSAGANWAQIRVAGKSAAMGQYTVPLGYAFHLQGAQFGISVLTAATPLRVTVQIEAEIDRHTGLYAAGVWTTIGWATGSVFTPPIIGPFPPGSYIRVPALATIRARAITDNASAIEIAGGFYGVLALA